jgi:molybdate transport system substrate-binding protein
MCMRYIRVDTSMWRYLVLMLISLFARNRMPRVIALILACALGPSWAFAADVPAVAAASDLQQALPEISAAFTSQTGRSVKLAMGSSGNFHRQIIQGAPFELFFSADEAYVQDLARRGLTVDDGALYAIGRLALFVPKASSVKVDSDLRDLAAAVSDGRLRKLAIANPEHAPYGRAARSALMRMGIWDQVQGRLVLGENVSQAAQFALSGSVEAALIAQSLVMTDAMKGLGESVLIPQAWHPPLAQRMVLLRSAGDTARQFYAFVQSGPGRATLNRHGFTVPSQRPQAE